MLRILFIFILFVSPLKSQWVIMSNEADSLVLRGSKLIYNCQFDSAELIFDEVIEKYPDHPVGYFLDAMVDWWRIKIHRNEAVYAQSFENKIEIVVDKCDDLLDENPKDLTALFFKGGALGYRGRYFAESKQWLSAATDGKEAFDIMLDCHEKAPGNHDIMLGSGIYNFYAAAIPEKYPLTKPLLAFLPEGNKKIGLLQLRSSAYHARYTTVEAKVMLLLSFYSFEKDYNSALFWAKELHEEFPDNAYFHRYYARSKTRMGKWEELEQEWRNIIKKCIKRVEGYNNLTAREGLYYVGLALQRKREYETALKYYNKCLEVGDYIDEEDSGYYLSAQFKIALIYDKTGKRDLAIKQYKKCLESEDYDGIHAKCKRYLEKAYR